MVHGGGKWLGYAVSTELSPWPRGMVLGRLRADCGQEIGKKLDITPCGRIMRRDIESEDAMTLHLPSRRLLIPVGALAVAGTVAAVVAIYWQTILLWAMFAAVARLAWRMLVGPSPHKRRSLLHWLEAGAVIVGGGSLLHTSRRVVAQRDELQAARVETERARAEELRSRVEYRMRTRGEQDKAERAAYWRGAIDGGRSAR